MPNEMIRPCTHEAFNDNEAFEAIGAVVSIVEGGISNGVQQFAVRLDLADGHSEELDFENRGMAYYTYQSVLLAIYEALNAPVLATEEVLKDLPDEGTVDCTWEDLPKFEVQVSPNENYNEEKEVMWMKPFYAFDEYPNGTIEGWFVYAPYYTEDGDWNMALTSIKGLKMRATNNETAEYLRQFTIDGVRIEEIDPLKGIPLFDPDVPLVQDEDEDEDFQNDITERELRGCHL